MPAARAGIPSAVAFAALVLAAALAPASASRASDVDVSSSPSLAPTPCLDPVQPPCGYIRPTLEILLPGATACLDGDECLALPDVGSSLTLAGTVRWWWDVARDGTYPADPGQPIQITFEPGQRNPSWLKGSVEPPMFTIDAAQLQDPRALEPGGDAATPQLLYVFERPINLTITRTGGAPTGVVEFLLKAKSSASGSYFTPAFAVKIIGLEATAQAESREASLPWAAVPAALLGALALRRIRGRKG